MKKVYIYEMPPIDYFVPFKTLEQIIVDVEKEVYSEQVEGTKQTILKLVETAKECFRKYTLWEGDGRVYVSGLPDVDYANSFYLIMIKQSNNGTTFLYSPVELPHLEEYLEATI